MPIVQAQIVAGRTAAQKRRLIAEVTDAVVRSIGAPGASVRVIVTEVPAENWGVAGEPKSPGR